MTLAARPSFIQLLVCLSLALLPCCGSPPTTADDAAPGQTTPIVASTSEAPPLPCRVVLTPVPLLEDATEQASERWSAATGCDVEVGPGGVPVELVAHVWRPDGTDAPGATSESRDLISINTLARGKQRERVVLHEMGHVLGMTSEHAVDDVIDSVALTEVCSNVGCSAFIPEAP